MALPRVVKNCMQLFQDHGIQHDKFMHSKATFNLLRETLLDSANFDYSHGTFKYRNTIFCGGSPESICKSILYDVEQRILRPIYKRVRATKNTRLLERVSKLDTLAQYEKHGIKPHFKHDPTDFDLEFMRLFVKYALKKKLVDAEFEKLAMAHLKSKDITQTINGVVEMALCMCVIS